MPAVAARACHARIFIDHGGSAGEVDRAMGNCWRPA
jgi:hypothetical protein